MTCRLPSTFQSPSVAAGLRTATYPQSSKRCGICREFLRSVSQSAKACGARFMSCCSVTVVGEQRHSSTSASSASSGAREAATISQKAAVLGGGLVEREVVIGGHHAHPALLPALGV